MKKRVLYAACFGVISAFGLVWPAAAQVQHVMQIAGEDGLTSRTVAWLDDRAGTYPVFSYKKKGDTYEKTASVIWGERPPLYAEGTERAWQSYTVRLTGLEAGTEYVYTVATETDRVEGAFTMPEKSPLEYKISVMGDSQSVDYGEWGKTVNAALRHMPQADLRISMGDLTDNGQAWFQWKEWLDEGRSAENIPLAPVLGNHEAYSMTWTFAEPETYSALFPVPQNGPEGQTGLAYFFDYGDVRFISLNTDEEELGAMRSNMLTLEAVWLERILKQSETEHKRVILLMHRSPWSAPYSGAKDVNGIAFLPLIDKYEVPLVFTAHEHCYARSSPLREGRPEAKGTVYITTGRSGSETWAEAVRRPFDVAYDDCMDLPVYVELRLRKDGFYVSAYKRDGRLIDEAVIPAKKK